MLPPFKFLGRDVSVLSRFPSASLWPANAPAAQGLAAPSSWRRGGQLRSSIEPKSGRICVPGGIFDIFLSEPLLTDQKDFADGEVFFGKVF